MDEQAIFGLLQKAALRTKSNVKFVGSLMTDEEVKEWPHIALAYMPQTEEERQITLEYVRHAAPRLKGEWPLDKLEEIFNRKEGGYESNINAAERST